MRHSATADETRWGVPFRVVALQAVATVLAAVVALAWGAQAALSVLLGGAVAFLPNACFAWMLGRGTDAGNGAAAAAGTLLRWLAKMALTIGLLVLALVFLAPVREAFLVGLVVALLAPLGAPLVLPKAAE